MKRKLLVLLSILSLTSITGCGVSQEEYNALQSKYDALKDDYDELQISTSYLETEVNDLKKELEVLNSNAAVTSDDTFSSTADTTSTETESSYNDISNGPSELELMSYAQTVLDNNLSGCEYSRDKREYNFVKTNLRYKIEGEVLVSGNADSEKFWMIIEFVDASYEVYDLISLQVGDDIIYESQASNAASLSASEEKGILSKENTEIYNEVMDILNSDYDREEDEIFEEIAPNYGMTSEELKKFMHDYMEAYYQ